MTETTFQLALLADVPPMAPMVILAICAVAGIGTVLLLPSRRESSIRSFGAVMLIAAGGILAALLLRWTAGSAEGGMGPYFWIFSTIAIGGAIRVITHTRPVYSALYFVLTVFASAGLFLLLRAEFMAAALVMIYAGAILVTYVFVIMLASEAANPGAKDAMAECDTVSRDPIFACAVGFAMMGVILFVIFDKYQTVQKFGPPADQSVASLGPTQQLGAFLFTNQLINLELAGLILTVAMVGAIVIARRQVENEDEAGRELEEPGEIVLGPATPVDDDPHSIPVYGTTNPSQKAFPET